MTIRDQLDNDLKDAMRAKDTLRTETLRNIRGAIRSRELDDGKDLDDASILAVIRSLVKQRDDSIEQYAQGNRQDLVDKETQEKKILLHYLPQAPTQAAVEAAVEAAITELGASTMQDMGRVMQACKEALGPSVDGKALGTLVRSKLAPGKA